MDTEQTTNIILLFVQFVIGPGVEDNLNKSSYESIEVQNNFTLRYNIIIMIITQHLKSKHASWISEQPNLTMGTQIPEDHHTNHFIMEFPAHEILFLTQPTSNNIRPG